MNKRWLVRACGIAAAGMILTGCTVAAADPCEPTAQTEPAASIASTALSIPVGKRFSFGDAVWSVRRSADGGDAYLVRYAVVAQDGDLVAVVPMFTPDPAAMRESLEYAAELPLDGTGVLDLVMVSNCYTDAAAAQAAAARENGHDDGGAA